MKNIMYHKIIYQKPSAKDNDNVICYADCEVIVCQ